MALFPTSTLFDTPFVNDSRKITQEWRRWLSAYFSQSKVAAHTIVIPKLTGGGTNGSITWNANGIVTSYVDPT